MECNRCKQVSQWTERGLAGLWPFGPVSSVQWISFIFTETHVHTLYACMQLNSYIAQASWTQIDSPDESSTLRSGPSQCVCIRSAARGLAPCRNGLAVHRLIIRHQLYYNYPSALLQVFRPGGEQAKKNLALLRL